MKIKGLIDEDFINYRKISMFISTCYCDWKCCKENNLPIETCQNCSLNKEPIIDISTEEIFRRYISNSISEAIVIGGLEPILQEEELHDFIKHFRDNNCLDDIIIYTGYYQYEIQSFVDKLKSKYTNIYFKFGRYIPNQEKHYDDVLGVYLASDNQKGEQVC